MLITYNKYDDLISVNKIVFALQVVRVEYTYNGEGFYLYTHIQRTYP